MKEKIRLSYIGLLLLLMLFSCGDKDVINPIEDQLSNKASFKTAGVKGLYEKDVPLDENNHIILYVTVEKLGRYFFTVPEQNGYKFTASGEFTELGDAEVKLLGEGTPKERQIDNVHIAIGENSKDLSVNVLADLINKIIVAAGFDLYTEVSKTIAFTGRGELLWEKSVSDYAAIANDVLYLNGKDGLSAVDIVTGNTLWSNTDLAGSISITAEDNVVYVAGYSNFHAVNAANGEIIWSYDSRISPYGAPLVGDELVYVSEQSDLYALNKTDGSLVWLKASINSSDTPLLNNGHLYFGAYNKFFVLNATDGSEVWSNAIDSNGSPVLSNGRLYVNGSGKVNCMDPATGELLWSTGISGLGFSPVVHENQVLVTTYNTMAAVYSLEASTGKELWKQSVYGFTKPELLAHEGMVYFGTTHSIHGCDVGSGDIMTTFGSFQQQNDPFLMDYYDIMVAYNTTTKSVAYPTTSGMD